MKKIEDYVLSIPDFPEPGIIFRDITSVLQDADGLQLAIDSMQDCLKDIDVDVIAGTESRGFIFGVPIAYNLHKPFVPIRKKGKLPRETVSVSYDLEYGSAEIEMHKDSIKPGQKVVIVDDLIATGGTIEAAIKISACSMECLIPMTEAARRHRITSNITIPVVSLLLTCGLEETLYNLLIFFLPLIFS